VSPAPGDQASVSVFVHVSRADAFDVFTREIDLWWKTGPRYRIAGKQAGRLSFAPGPGGEVTETVEHPAGPRRFVVGKVTRWEPPGRVELEWRLSNFAPDEKTLVEVLFVEQGEGTLVTVRHRGWAALRPDHPARHGQQGAELSRRVGLWWGDLLTALREHAEERRV
jgi:uncharacterized protein YndB with AHSA1/START domain